jgi:hypothetical protein
MASAGHETLLDHMGLPVLRSVHLMAILLPILVVLEAAESAVDHRLHAGDKASRAEIHAAGLPVATALYIPSPDARRTSAPPGETFTFWRPA